MAKIIMFLVESIAISALLYLLYWGLFKDKASYFAQRVLLLSIPFIATISAFASFELIGLHRFSDKVIEDAVVTNVTTASNIDNTETISINEFKIIRSDSYSFGMDDYALLVWGFITLLLLSLFIWRLSKIISLRKVAAKEIHPDYSIYRLWSDDIIFSFWRSIYIGKELNGNKLDLAMRHELEHIRRCHYIDKVIAEIYAIAMWFNPITKIIQREISLIHEYEADLAVVRSGCDVKAYKMFIFEEVTTSVPTFANGISSSQIKKRFVAMGKRYKVSHQLLRVLMTTITFVVIAAASTVYVEAKEARINDIKDIPPEEIEEINIDRENSLVTITKKDGTVVSYDPKEPYKIDTTPPERAPGVDAKREQLYVTRNKDYNNPIYVVRCDDHTKVYIGANILWNRHWFVLSEEMYLIAPKSGDKYMLHSSGTDLPLEKVITVVGQKDKFVYFELIFPPLDKGINRVELKEWAKAATTVGWPKRKYDVDHIGWHYSNIKVEKELPNFVSAEYQAQQNQEPRVIKLDENFEPK